MKDRTKFFRKSNLGKPQVSDENKPLLQEPKKHQALVNIRSFPHLQLETENQRHIP